jgi:hypothetical protein
LHPDLDGPGPFGKGRWKRPGPPRGRPACSPRGQRSAAGFKPRWEWPPEVPQLYSLGQFQRIT